MDKQFTGSCACGAVTDGFDSEPSFIANCHCTDCKRASGGEMATFAAVGAAKDFPDTVFVQEGTLDRLDAWFAPQVEIYTWSREPWMIALDIPQFDHGPR